MSSHYQRQQRRSARRALTDYDSPPEENNSDDNDPDAMLEGLIADGYDYEVLERDWDATINTIATDYSAFGVPPVQERVVRTRAQARREAGGSAADSGFAQQPPPWGEASLLRNTSVVTIDAGSASNYASPAAKRRRTAIDLQQPSTSGVQPQHQSPAPSMASQSADASDTQCCICFLPYNSSGEHRVATLRCGHLFGQCCITQWVQQEKSKALCPMCKKKATMRDIIPLFVKCVKAVDSAELDDLRSVNTGLMEENTRLKEENLVLNAANEDMEERCEAMLMQQRQRGTNGDEIAARLRKQIAILQKSLKESEGRAVRLEKEKRELSAANQRLEGKVRQVAQQHQRPQQQRSGPVPITGSGGTPPEVINERLRQQIKKLQERLRQLVNGGGATG